MKWVIKNPAPSDSRMQKWGDFHFGRSLSKYLVRLGHQVETHYDPAWDTDSICDAVLVLRGKYAYPPSECHGNALRVMWNISHPGDVAIEEYESYDLVLVASQPWAARLGEQISKPVFAMLQCTDLEEFFVDEPSAEDARDGFVFVGNTRDVERPGVLWALEYGLPLKIWGRGWARFDIQDRVVGDYIPNEELSALYLRSRVTLNDHWSDMTKYGFINNRVFDALACGLPVVSDQHAELKALFPKGILFYRDQDEFNQCMERLLLSYPSVQEDALDARGIVERDFSFERRALELSYLTEVVSKFHGRSSIGGGRP